MKKIFFSSFVSLFPIFLFSQNNYYPVRKDAMDISNYDRLKSGLTKIYATINTSSNKNNLANAYVNKANIFVQLGEKRDSIFAQIENAYSIDSVTTCRLVKHFNTVNSYDFRDNCMRMDSMKWQYWCNKCSIVLLKVPKKTEISTLNLQLKEKLKKIYEDDQKYRGDSAYNFNIEQYEVMSFKQRILDSINLGKIKEIIDQYGYPGKSLVGDNEMTAFYVIQHSPDLKIRELFLPDIKKAVKNKEVSKLALIMLLDRIYMEKYNTQIWGTQQKRDNSDLNRRPVLLDISEETLKIKKEIDDM